MSIASRRRALMGAQDNDLRLNDILTLDGIQNTRAGHDASSNKWEDLSGNNYDFAKASTAGTLDLLWGTNCLQFDGTARRLYKNASLFSGLSLVTIELIFKPTGRATELDNGNYYGIIYKNGASDSFKGLSLQQYESYGVSAYYGDNSTNIGYTSVSLNTTKYIAYVFSGSSVKRYVNGTLAGTVSATFSPSDVGPYNYMGYMYGHLDRHPYGNFYRLGISGSALSADEIAERYQYFKRRFAF